MSVPPHQPSDPAFASPVLASIASAFRRRRKAIAYRTDGFELTQETGADGHERLNVDVLIRRTQIRASFWDDHSFWYRACHPRPSARGWEFMLAFSGEVRDIEPEELVAMFERSLGCAHGRDANRHTQDILAHWKRVRPTVERNTG